MPELREGEATRWRRIAETWNESKHVTAQEALEAADELAHHLIEAADALAASQEKLEQASEDRREVQRVLQAQLQASQEKKWQAEFDNGRLVGELAASQEKERAYEEAAREVVALYRGWRLREPEGRAAIKRLAKLAGLDSTQTHGGSNA